MIRAGGNSRSGQDCPHAFGKNSNADSNTRQGIIRSFVTIRRKNRMQKSAKALLVSTALLLAAGNAHAQGSCGGYPATQYFPTAANPYVYGTQGRDVMEVIVSGPLSFDGAIVYGFGGDDQICIVTPAPFAGTFASTVDGGDGLDIIIGSSSNDAIFGGNGPDIIVAGSASDYVRGGPGNDYIEGNDGRDQLLGDNGLDTIFGGLNNDHIEGNGDNDELYGGPGFDDIYGGQGNDFCNIGTDGGFTSSCP
jgi:Ca2+-binding RTX toxin-like protein